MTNQLFRDYLDGRIPVRRRIRPGFYFMPVGSFDPAAPTLKDLASAINLSQVVTIGVDAAWEDEDAARNRAIANMGAASGQSFADMEAALLAMGAAAGRFKEPKYVMPPPPYPVGNIATQKRRRRL